VEHSPHLECSDEQEAACIRRIFGLFFTHNLLSRKAFTTINMNTASDIVLDEVWAVKDRLSANTGHDLAATCRAIYFEQAEIPERFIVLGKPINAQRSGADQPATRSVLESEGI